jgi:hypothetical protein
MRTLTVKATVEFEEPFTFYGAVPDAEAYKLGAIPAATSRYSLTALI